MLGKCVLLLLGSLFVALNFSCQSLPTTNFSKYKQASFKIKAAIKNKIKNRSNIVYINVDSIKNQKLRLDVINTFVGHLASVLIDQNKLTYVLPKQKDYYSGPATARSLQRVLKIDVSPQVLYNVFFFEKVIAKSWACEDQVKSFSCMELKSGLNVIWSKNRDLVIMDHEDVEIRMSIRNVDSKIQNEKNRFSLPKPTWFVSK